MTKHNLLTLCGLLIACGLQAGQPSQPSQPASQQTAADQNAWSGRKKLGVGALGLGGTLAAGSYAAPGWRDYFLNKGSDALSSVGGYASRAWDWSKGVPVAGAVPRAIGWTGSTGYDYGQRAASAGWQALKAAPSATWEGLKSAPGTIAGYATSPYIAQGIAQRFPRASFVSDYPGITNLAALAGLAGAGYGLYKTGQYAADAYYGPLDSQLSQLLAQEELLKKTLDGEHRTVTLPNGSTVLTQQGGLINKFNETSDRTEKNTIYAQIRNIELDLGTLNNQIRSLFVAKVNEITTQAPADQKITTLEALLKKDPNITLPGYYDDPRFIEAVMNKLGALNKNPAPGYFGWWKRS